MAGMVGASGRGIFTTSISQSPVTDWRYYGGCGHILLMG